MVVAVVVVGGGAAAYGLTAGSKPAANLTNAAGQTQNCVSKTGVLYVTSAAVKKCPKGMTPAQGSAGASSATPSPSRLRAQALARAARTAAQADPLADVGPGARPHALIDPADLASGPVASAHDRRAASFGRFGQLRLQLPDRHVER